MSVEAMTWAFQVPLKPCPKSVLVALANRADEDGYCWPGIEDLELRTGWGRRSIQRALVMLEQDGYVEIHSRFSTHGAQKSNLYRLAIPGKSLQSDQFPPEARHIHKRAGVQHLEKGDSPSPGGCLIDARGVSDRRRGGVSVSPKSSSESSFEQSLESPPKPPTGGVCAERLLIADEEFERFWAAYPSKVGKKKALVAWQKATDRPGLEAVLQAIELAKKGDRWQRGIIPNPTTWLNQGRWADVVPGPVKLPSDPLPKAFTAVTGREVQGEECPPEVAAILGRILHGNAHSFPADQQGAA